MECRAMSDFRLRGRPVRSPSSGFPMSSIARFLRSESGATTAEYGIIIVVVAGIAIFVLSQLNDVMNRLYSRFGSKVNLVN
jgi:Flp pilus assembly pilin Flp